MTIILNIDSSVEGASICIGRDGVAGKVFRNPGQHDQASWMHVAIRQLLGEENLQIGHIGAIAVSNGPGSYTGLRISLSTAKGLCFALNIPLITLGTLEIMARAMNNPDENLLCPLIDARRMEVYTALYNSNFEPLISPTALILNENSFSEYLISHKILFFGNGSSKLKSLNSHENARFSDLHVSASDMAMMSHQYLIGNKFSNIAYAQPLYLKDFHSSSHFK